MVKMRSDNIGRILRQEDILETVLRRKKDWLRKIEEMPEESLAKPVYIKEMPIKRPRGGLEDDLICLCLLHNCT